MKDYVQLNGRIKRPKSERFKNIVKKSGKKQEFAIEEALDMYCDHIERSIS